MILQQLIVLMILLAWISAIWNLRKKNINLGEFILWSVLWLSLLVVSAFPTIPSTISALLGVGRGVDLVIYASIFVIFFLMFKLYIRMERQEKDLTKLVRELAIKRVRRK